MNFSTDQVINLLSDADSRNILNLIVSDTTDTGVTLHLTKTNLTRKQYYYRLGELIRYGIIRKINGKYFLSTFGKMICDIWFKSIKELDDIVENYWRLKAIDLLDISDEFTDEERNRIVNSLFNTTSNLLIAKEHKLPKTAQYLKKQ